MLCFVELIKMVQRSFDHQNKGLKGTLLITTTIGRRSWIAWRIALSVFTCAQKNYRTFHVITISLKATAKAINSGKGQK